MAKFLTTNGNSYYIEQIILNAEKSLTIVSPYLKISRSLLGRLRDADRSGIRMSFIYGKSQMTDTDTKALKEIENLEVFYCTNLHAKCYFNETQLIVSSMNFHEFSEKNNREMGILIDKTTDGSIYSEILKEVESIKHDSEKQKTFVNEDKKQQIMTPILTEEVSPRVNSKFKDVWNYYLPCLHDLMSRTYPQLKLALTDEIMVMDYPRKGTKISISGRIDFSFSPPCDYNLIERLNRGKIEKNLPGVRFYWNEKVLNVYLEKNYIDERTPKGEERKARRLGEIFSTVCNKMKFE